MGKRTWGQTVERALGCLATPLVLLGILTLPTNKTPGHFAYLGFSALLASGVLGRRMSSVQCFSLGLMAILTVPTLPNFFDIPWKLFKVFGTLVPCLTCGCFPGRKQKHLQGAALVVGLACAAQVARLFWPVFLPENSVPANRVPPPVETPALRELYCGKSAPPPEGMGYMCTDIVPLSWDDAEAKARKTLALMTPAERHSLMQGIGWQGLPPFIPLPLPAFPKLGYYMGNTPAILRLGLPALKEHDAGNGFRNNPSPVGKPFTTIMWPSSLAFGATWNAGLVEKVAAAIGREYRGKGANVILGPSVQVHRVTRNGRNFEYMSGEDPYLGSVLADAYVRGVQSQGIIACLKHYGFNEQETQRNGGNFIVDERTAWEIYYAPFEAGVAAGAGSVMCSYNRVNGTYACANEELLSRDLKIKMGFRGFVMSDWWALHDPPERSVVRGFDQEMPGAGPESYLYADKLREMEEKKAGTFRGYLEKDRSDIYSDPAFRIVATAWKMRLDERPSCLPGTSECVEALYSDQRSQENSDLARRTATESVMLLKNDGVLPIDPSKIRTIALVGIPLNASSLSTADIGMAGDYYSGGGSGHCYVEPDQLVTPLRGLTERAESLGIRVLASPSNDLKEAVSVAERADLTVILAATTAEEGKDRDSLSLDFQADNLIHYVAELRPTVALAQVPGAILTSWRDDVKAFAMMFLGGEHTSSAWVSVVFGDVSPSGKLPIMLPKDMRGVIEPGISPVENHYSEGLFSSYRSKNVESITAFPFGHGLSYTDFTYAEPKQLPKSKCTAYACIQTAVTNSGSSGRSGAEVAQAYVEFPPEAEEPKLVLRGFHKTAVLSANRAEVVTFNFTERDLSIYRHGGWQVQKGIVVHVGASSMDLRHTVVLKDLA